MSRRGFMQFGLAGMATLSWPGLLKLRAANAALPKTERKSIIMVWLPGGQSHIDTYDPKPEARSEYRGPFKTISTKVPGTHFTELLPMSAKIADKFTVLRSMHQSAGGHPAGTMQMFSGDSDTRDKPKPRLPDWMSVAHYLRAKEGGRTNPLPNYIGVPAASQAVSKDTEDATSRMLARKASSTGLATNSCARDRGSHESSEHCRHSSPHGRRAARDRGGDLGFDRR